MICTGFEQTSQRLDALQAFGLNRVGVASATDEETAFVASCRAVFFRVGMGVWLWVRHSDH